MKKMGPRQLKKLKFERDDYQRRWQKLVNRVKLQIKELEEQASLIRSLESQIANDSLALVLAIRRAKDMEAYVTLKRPDVLRLIATVEKQRAAASAGVQQPITLNLTQRRRAPRIAI